MEDDKPPTGPSHVVPFKPKERVGWDDPADAIIEFADEVKAGKHKPKHVLILFYETTEEGRLMARRWFANCSTTEAIALLAAAQHQELEDWKR